MKRRFSGFDSQALKFLRQLERHNDRDWFTPRKQQYQALLYEPMCGLVARINDDLRKFAVENVTEPKKSIYRIYRDTRFSKDKTPYKTHIAAIFPHQKLPKHAGAGFYLSVSHKEVEVCGGIYMPGPEELAAIRAKINDEFPGFEKLLKDRNLRKLCGDLIGEKLTRPPKGFPSDSPAGEYLRMKQWYFYVRLDPALASSAKLLPEVLKRFRAIHPVNRFFNEAILEAMHGEADDRPRRPEPMF